MDNRLRVHYDAKDLKSIIKTWEKKVKKDFDSTKALKKIKLIDKIRQKIEYILGYREGKSFIDDTEPFIRSYSDIELTEIADIEQKLKNALARNATEGKLIDGIKKDDAQKLLEWVIQRDRTILGQNCDIKKASLLGACGLSQGVISTLLTNMGLKPRISSVNPTITEVRASRTCF